MVRKLIVSLIHPRLEYAATVWSPSKKKDMIKLERIQRAGTKLEPYLMDESYEERLLELNLITLEQRKERRDLIAVCRMMKGMEDLDRDDLIIWDTRNTKGHDERIKKKSCRRDIKKKSFPHSLVDVWNGLKEELVQSEKISKFKAKLDIERVTETGQHKLRYPPIYYN